MKWMNFEQQQQNNNNNKTTTTITTKTEIHFLFQKISSHLQQKFKPRKKLKEAVTTLKLSPIYILAFFFFFFFCIHPKVVTKPCLLFSGRPVSQKAASHEAEYHMFNSMKVNQTKVLSTFPTQII